MRVGMVILVGIVLLAGLFHFCPGDRVSETSAIHVCPVCATTGTAIVSPAPALAVVAVLNRLESLQVLLGFTSSVARITAPRAPPVL